MHPDSPIGVFDSGVGGLSVLRILRERMPAENVIYLADSGRVPYGTKNAETVIRYSREAAANLAADGVKAIVIACNTATVAALDTLIAEYPDIPVIGVVEPGARIAAETTKNGRVGLVATLGTVKSGGHERIINHLRPGTIVSGIPAPLFVSLAEEGWMDGKPADAVAERYLAPVFHVPAAEKPDCLILGCTHFPFLDAAIRKAVGEDVTLIDPAAFTIDDLHAALAAKKLLRPSGRGGYAFRTSADPERFARVGGLFLGIKLTPGDIETVQLGAI